MNVEFFSRYHYDTRVQHENRVHVNERMAINRSALVQILKKGNAERTASEY